MTTETNILLAVFENAGERNQTITFLVFGETFEAVVGRSMAASHFRDAKHQRLISTDHTNTQGGF